MCIETATTDQARRELEEVVDRLIKGVRDPGAMRKSRERMDRMREELRQRIGTVEVAVDLIRDARNAGARFLEGPGAAGRRRQRNS